MNQPQPRHEALRDVRVFVTGAAGFIGRWIASRLSRTGARLTLGVRDAAAAKPIFARWGVQGVTVEIDLARPGTAGELVEAYDPQVIFNLAGYGVDRSEEDSELGTRINTELVCELADAVKLTNPGDWSGQRFVHVGSAFEYGWVGGDLSEDGPVEPIGWYGASKLKATQELVARTKREGLKSITARLFTVYGPGEHRGRLLPSLLEAARSEDPLSLTAGTQRRDFTYVEDVAEGLLRLATLDRCADPVVNLATGKLFSVRSFAEMASGVLGIGSQRLRFGAIPQRGEEMMHEPVSTQRLNRLISWIPSTKIEDGVRKTLQFETDASGGEFDGNSD